ncbi:MAG: ATP-binding cassette domain-containing protein [Anaerolineales bacterium]|jgi:ABC-2 type transport system ATP-binding protein
MTAAISTQALTKAFGDKLAVVNLTLDVEPGEVFGFLGPNGAGKTTAVKMLLGLISPTSGSGQVLGAPIGDHHSREKVGFLPEHFRFHEWLTAEEFLRLHGNLYQLPAPVLNVRVPELLEQVGLGNHSGKKLRTFSKGMLQRIGLAQALLNEPDLVFLDEPTSGLDPVGRRLVRDIIRELSDRGTTVFLNSHLLSEVEITCDRVAFIRQGEVLTTNSLQSLVEGEFTVEIRARNINQAVIDGLARWGENVRSDGDHLSMTLSSEADMPNINRFLVEQGVDVYAIRPKQLSLEDLFIQVVGTEGGL